MFDTLTVIVLVLAIGYIGYVVFEHFYHARLRKKIGKVIHVNGIRGKSTVTRLIDAGLRECGVKVFSKTTGTVPSVIDVNGVECPIKRHAPANIREQLSVLRQAAKQNADALVVECMAVNPELQYVCERRILHSDICVITNVRADHLDEMGEDLESIAYSLANTTPQNGALILGEDKFKEVFQTCAQNSNAQLFVAEELKTEVEWGGFPENVAVAMKVCDVLGLDRTVFLNGMKKYYRDPGALSVFQIENTSFINAFSVNDPQSTLNVYEKVIKKYPAEEITVLLNSRGDRAFRVEQHVEMLQRMRFKKVIVIGANQGYIRSRLLKAGIEAQSLKSFADLLLEKYVFGCGNIAADGMKIVNFFKTNGEEIHG